MKIIEIDRKKERACKEEIKLGLIKVNIKAYLISFFLMN